MSKKNQKNTSPTKGDSKSQPPKIAGRGKNEDLSGQSEFGQFTNAQLYKWAHDIALAERRPVLDIDMEGPVLGDGRQLTPQSPCIQVSPIELALVASILSLRKEPGEPVNDAITMVCGCAVRIREANQGLSDFLVRTQFSTNARLTLAQLKDFTGLKDLRTLRKYVNEFVPETAFYDSQEWDWFSEPNAPVFPFSVVEKIKAAHEAELSKRGRSGHAGQKKSQKK